ncbi:ABC-2 family transporter protein [uncultured Clostridium sp.]|uniref:ABC transporter permease n=1 Tax=uncultured Clostridium sp. TaxID=59620 RepID=UPI0008216560|nr:ABC transporter permease [uncultured Clostridium sp.]SCJ08167.1 ABC-2 family transporter protein [uncultured Clostridium sp.]
MGLMRLTLINIKRHLKNPFMLIIILILPIGMILFLSNGGGSEGIGSIGVIDNSKSQYSDEIIDKLNEKYSVQIVDGTIEENINLLRENKVGAIYVIDSNFKEVLDKGEAPKVKAYKSQATTGAIMAEDVITTYINNKLQEDISAGLSTNSVVTTIQTSDVVDKGEYTLTIVMICYLMMIGGSLITEDIMKLKAQKVLRRTISTANSDIEILGSLFLSTFIIQGALSSLAFIILQSILKMPNCNIAQGILIIFLASMFTTAIIVAVTRWIKNQILASLFIVLFGLMSFGIAMFSLEFNAFESVPEIINKISIISPFTWLLKIINTGEVLIPIFIITLMSAVFFTAGSFRLREFVKE